MMPIAPQPPQPRGSRIRSAVDRACILTLVPMAVFAVFGLGLYLGQQIGDSRRTAPLIIAADVPAPAVPPVPAPDTRQRFTIGGEEYVFDAGSAITIDVDENIEQPSTVLRADQTGNYRTTSVTSTEPGASNFAADYPSMNVGGLSVAGGGLSWDVISAGKSLATPFIIVGLVMLIAGGVIAWQWSVPYGLGLVAFALGTIAIGVFIEKEPRLFIVFGLMVASAAGIVLYREWKQARIKASAEVIIEGVQKAPAPAAAAVKASIENIAIREGVETAVKNTVTSIKSALGLSTKTSQPATPEA